MNLFVYKNSSINIKLFIKVIFVSIVILITNCSKNSNTENINNPPSEFEVSINSSSYTNVEITWSESFDPENEIVKYSVYLEGEEYISNLTSRNYTFDGLTVSTSYNGYVVAYDPSINERIADFSFTTTENLPPNDFELISITPSNVSLNVNWTEAVDPEGENVTYDMYIDGQLVVSGITQQYFSFEDLSAASVYNIKIVAKDEAENTTELIFNGETSDGIYQGDVSFRTQDGINNFGELGYIEITGNLEMDALAAFTNITDLSPINSIKKVNGYFIINFIDTLTSLSGLGIEHVGQSFRITQNDNLENLNGLESLIKVFGAFQIEQNSNLLDISGMNNLTTIGEYLSIHNNINLSTVSDFDSLNSVDSIWLQANWSLTQINAFNNVTELIGDLNITDNTSLTTINGLNNIETIGRVFVKNTLIENFDSLSSLSVVSGDFDIQNNSTLENISGLSSLNEITYGNLSFFNNDSLISLSGLENLDQVGNTINFVGNGSLSDFCSLQNLMQNSTTGFNTSIYNNLYNPTTTDIVNGNCSN